MKLVTLPERKPDEAAIQLFMQHLGASHEIASMLAMEHSSIQEIAYVPMEELLETGLEEPVLESLRAKARCVLESS